ncbi:MAG: hypothetical protein KGM47_08415 [Acidobacteriota bacterium]|nr:hypothetical protein [Acidobacteriota bacterium]
MDGRVSLDQINGTVGKGLFYNWMTWAAGRVGIDQKTVKTLRWTVFEVRQGDKSKDSKHRNANIANAATADKKAYIRWAVFLSSTNGVGHGNWRNNEGYKC